MSHRITRWEIYSSTLQDTFVWIVLMIIPFQETQISLASLPPLPCEETSAQIEDIWPICKIYLSKLQNLFVHIARYICLNYVDDHPLSRDPNFSGLTPPSPLWRDKCSNWIMLKTSPRQHQPSSIHILCEHYICFRCVKNIKSASSIKIAKQVITAKCVNSFHSVQVFKV